MVSNFKLIHIKSSLDLLGVEGSASYGCTVNFWSASYKEASVKVDAKISSVGHETRDTFFPLVRQNTERLSENLNFKVQQKKSARK